MALYTSAMPLSAYPRPRATSSNPIRSTSRPDAPSAVEAVAALLEGRVDDAFGESLEWWCDVLLDAICEPADFRFLLICWVWARTTA